MECSDPIKLREFLDGFFSKNQIEVWFKIDWDSLNGQIYGLRVLITISFNLGFMVNLRRKSKALRRLTFVCQKMAKIWQRVIFRGGFRI